MQDYVQQIQQFRIDMRVQIVWDYDEPEVATITDINWNAATRSLEYTLRCEDGGVVCLPVKNLRVSED